ncbi:hypothetical protein [Nocardia sp. NPDC057227]|uniref:hypothetical protein n=1 Tax=Nocardia sp. NPDC057227 TaxID=3346056 RepID=UPI00363B713C
MRSNKESGPRTEGTAPQPRFANPAGHWERMALTPAAPVWVRLDAVLVRDPGAARRVNGSGVEFAGEVRGQLTHWVPTVDGFWMGRVDYTLRYADGRALLQVRDQLVPGYALRPRMV